MAIIPKPAQFDLKPIGRTLIAPRDNAMRLIVNSYRRRVLAHHPKAVFETKFVLGIDVEEWANILETEFSVGINWANYNKSWQVQVRKNASHFNMEDAEDFYQYFRYTNFGVKSKIATGFISDPDGVSPLDRDGDQV